MATARTPASPARPPAQRGTAPARPRLRARTQRRRHPIQRIFGESRGVTVLVLVLLGFIGLLIVRPMVRSMLSYHRTAELLTERRAEVATLRDRRAELLEQVQYYQTNAFIAERAREYGLVYPGEKPYVIRELVHPELMGQYAQAQMNNAAYGTDDAILSAGS